jgi:hypothetical protein
MGIDWNDIYNGTGLKDLPPGLCPRDFIDLIIDVVTPEHSLRNIVDYGKLAVEMSWLRGHYFGPEHYQTRFDNGNFRIGIHAQDYTIHAVLESTNRDPLTIRICAALTLVSGYREQPLLSDDSNLDQYIPDTVMCNWVLFYDPEQVAEMAILRLKMEN